MTKFLEHNKLSKIKELSVMNADLFRRVDKLPLSGNNVLIAIVEAVVNAIQAVKEGDVKDGKIDIVIERDSDQLTTIETQEDILPPITGFSVTDNGVGFDNLNYDAFNTLDSSHKEKIGGRGVGRLQWLKVFQKVEISSVFKENGNMFRREFFFTLDQEVKETVSAQPVDSLLRTTTVRLMTPLPKYVDRFKDCTLEKLARVIRENCLCELLDKHTRPSVTVHDGKTGESEDILQLIDNWIERSSPTRIDVKGEPFEVNHLILKEYARPPLIVYYGHNRPVKKKKLNDLIPELDVGYAKAKNFGYLCQVKGAYLDEHVVETRDRFDISSGDEDGQVFATLTETEIEAEVVNSIRDHLSSEIAIQKNENIRHVREYVEQKNPRYRIMLPEIMKEVSFTAREMQNDAELEGKLHSVFVQLDKQYFRDTGEFLKSITEKTELDEASMEKIKDFVARGSRLMTNDLAGYVLRRKVVLDIFRKIMGKSPHGKYSNESAIHQLIMPMGKTSDEVEFERQNLWIIDERLTFHHFLASEVAFRHYPILDSDEEERPDILGLRYFDNPLYFSDRDIPSEKEIVIIEFKRPMRPDVGKADSELPHVQALRYLRRLRHGKLKTIDGRAIPEAAAIPCHIYVICDINDKLEGELEIGSFSKASNRHYYQYHDNLKAFIEVLSYDALLENARERNYAFFDVLGIPKS